VYLPPAKGDPCPRGVAEAILLSIDTVTAADPTGLCGDLLGVISLLSPEGVSRNLLYGGEPYHAPTISTDCSQRVPVCVQQVRACESARGGGAHTSVAVVSP